ncbi:betaine--homocysteine S-methyltransferase [Candidatus Puniceispirillum sp.]|nr:betaine--homocysteine S-methyltransferase [Candidatus Puniceispirillum sp.]
MFNLINTKGWCVADGATGTNLFNRGLETGYPPELWSVERPDDVIWLHNGFLQAGSDLILTNSFGGTGFRLKLHNAQDRTRALNIAAAKLARRAVEAHFRATGKKAIVAGSIGPTGELFEPLGHLTHSSALAGFSEQAEALAEGGVDLLWIETMSSTEEVAAAIEAAKATGLPICATMTFDTASRSMMGVMPADFAEFARGLGANFIGANCGIGPAELLHSVRGILTASGSLPVVAKGNCGIPAYVEGAIHYHGTPELMAEYALFARDAGAKIIGGCCGTSPAHVAAMVAALDKTPPRDFDEAAMVSALGEAWADVKIDNSGGDDRRKRRHRRQR